MPEIYREVKKVEIITYTLKLSQEEIEVIRAILERIGGSPDKSRRGICDKIRKEIDSIKVSYNCDDITNDNRAIYFINNVKD